MISSTDPMAQRRACEAASAAGKASPEVVTELKKLLSAQLDPALEHSVLLRFYEACVKESLNETVYPAREAYFLYFILHFFETTLAGVPGLDPARLASWLAQRRAQVQRGELVYIAHQIDFCGRVGSVAPPALPGIQ